MKSEQEKRARATGGAVDRWLDPRRGLIRNGWLTSDEAAEFANEFAALARAEAIEECAKLAEAPTESGLRVPNAGRIADRIRSLRAPAAKEEHAGVAQARPSSSGNRGTPDGGASATERSVSNREDVGSSPAPSSIDKPEDSQRTRLRPVSNPDGKRAADQDPPASPAPDRAALKERIHVDLDWYCDSPAKREELERRVMEIVLRERAAEQEKLYTVAVDAFVPLQCDTKQRSGVLTPSAPHATGTSTGEPLEPTLCPHGRYRSRCVECGAEPLNASIDAAPAQPAPDVFAIVAGEWYGPDYNPSMEVDVRLMHLLKARFGPLVEALEWYRDQTDTPGMARAALARLRQEGG